MTGQASPNKGTPRPFLKWAGGKRWLLDRKLLEFPKFSGRYIEPFLGGGSVYFHLRPQQSILSDANPDLISCYQQLRDNLGEVIGYLREHHRRHDAEHYYKLRAQSPSLDAVGAARFIYLNRTCFNGLYRVNKRGEFNVPIGTKTKVFDEQEDLAAVSRCLEKSDLRVSDFEDVIDLAYKGDFLFVDPPYTVRHNANGFLKYNERIFSWDDQVRLRNALERAAQRGVAIVATNAAHESVLELYQGLGSLTLVDRASVLAGKGAARGATQESLLKVGWGGAE